MVIGIDVGGTTVKFGLVKLNGEIVYEKRIKTNEASSNGLTETMLEEVQSILKQFPEVEGVGIGFPGLVSFDRMNVILLPNIPNFTNQPIVETFKQKFPSLLIKIENDAKCAALGELQFGEAKELDDFLFVALGTGVGGGFIQNRKLFIGARGNATEIGHMYSPIDGKTLEQHLGLNQIIEFAKNKLINNSYSTSITNKDSITPKLLFEAAKENDALALAVWEHVGQLLGYGLVSIMRFSDVNKFVIGGGVAGAFDFFIPHTQKIIQESLPAYYLVGLEFIKASVGDNAGVLGAASLIYHSYGKN